MTLLLVGVTVGVLPLVAVGPFMNATISYHCNASCKKENQKANPKEVYMINT